MNNGRPADSQPPPAARKFAAPAFALFKKSVDMTAYSLPPEHAFHSFTKR
jgi:hypothetical protein